MGHDADDWDGHRCSTFRRVSDWARGGRLDLKGLLTHRYDPACYREALQVASDKEASGAIKVAFRFGPLSG
jgi:threonine dehydrogenase-like Zn-dependent dehydrogenase